MRDDVELIINTVDGWVPDTRLYRVKDDAHYLISVRNNDTLSTQLRQQWGVVIDEATVDAAPVEVFAATVEHIPKYQWEPDDDTTGEPPEDREVVESADGMSIEILVDGQRWGGLHQEQIGESLRITVIDADGDPLNGLTPLYTLDPGTTFEQALDHIIEQEP